MKINLLLLELLIGILVYRGLPFHHGIELLGLCQHFVGLSLSVLSCDHNDLTSYFLGYSKFQLSITYINISVYRGLPFHHGIELLGLCQHIAGLSLSLSPLLWS